MRTAIDTVAGGLRSDPEPEGLFIDQLSHSENRTFVETRRVVTNRAASHFADRLHQACQDKGTPLCVGLDPVYEDLPLQLQAADFGASAQLSFSSVSPAWRGCIEERRDQQIFHEVRAIRRFCRGVLEAIQPHVACIKIQSACFERYHGQGVIAFYNVVREASEMGFIVIADAKRGDIGISAAHYATGGLATPPFTHFGEGAAPDAVTINPYFGSEGIDPFVDEAKRTNKGVFTLVRTSNPTGDEIQDQRLMDGRTVADVVAHLLSRLGSQRDCIGKCGYSLLGAVVGATKIKDTARLRRIMPQQIFLIPGVGAQGGRPEDLKVCFDNNGFGAIVAASRSIINAHMLTTTADWKGKIEEATVELKQRVGNILDRKRVRRR